MSVETRNQTDDDALDEARNEGFEEGYAEGAADQAGWATDTAHAVLRWLDKNGDGFDIHHPDGNTTDAIIQGLYDAKRAGNLAELRQAAARLRAMEEALKPFAEAQLLSQSAVIVAGDGITQAFDSGKKHVTCLMEEDGGTAFNRARAALSGEGQ